MNEKSKNMFTGRQGSDNKVVYENNTYKVVAWDNALMGNVCYNVFLKGNDRMAFRTLYSYSEFEKWLENIGD